MTGENTMTSDDRSTDQTPETDPITRVPSGAPQGSQSVSFGRAIQQMTRECDSSNFVNITMNRSGLFTVTFVNTEVGMTHFQSSMNDTIQAGLDELDAWAKEIQQESDDK
jgi:hypothetical protein